MFGTIFLAQAACFCYHNFMELVAQKREQFGKAVKALRHRGLIPAELYGHGFPNMHLAVSDKEFAKVFKEAGTNTVVNLLVDKENFPVLVCDYERDRLTGDFIHIDFYRVRMDEKIAAKVIVEFIGESPAVKGKGGILNKVMSDVEVEALPADLPRRFAVDLSNLLEIGESIYVKDLKAPAGVKILVDPETVVVTVTQEEAEEKAEEPVDISAVKVEAEEKKAERAQEKQEKEGKEEAAG